ncbi:hypothetical protein GEMRC1_004125 [Eukaryota sp. GEM-RC1]
MFNFLSPRHAWFPFREIAFFNKKDSKTWMNRFLSFKNAVEWRNHVISFLKEGTIPERFEIGAIYNIPLQHKQLAGAYPVSREFVIDIDTDDYDVVRRCHQKSSYCSSCFALLSHGAYVVTHLLKHCFNLTDVIWIYSGRRGLHGWVVDKGSRKMSNTLRSRIAKFLNLVSSRDPGELFSQLPQQTILSLMDGLIDEDDEPGVLTSLYKERAKADLFDAGVEGTPIYQDFLDRIKGKHGPLVSTIERDVAAILATTETHVACSQIQAKFESHFSIKENHLLYYEFVWWCVGPRLDVNVSSQMNHLLKAPFVFTQVLERFVFRLNRQKF